MRLETSRLTLRPVTVDDAADINAYMSDPLVTRETVAGPEDLDATRAFLEGVARAGDAHVEFAIVEKATGDVVGHVGYEPWGDDAAELGWMIRRDRWGRGYATEAAQQVAHFAAELEGVERVVARCRPSNPASVHVMEKLHLNFAGTLHDDVVVDGHEADSLLYEASAADLREFAGT